MACIFLNGWFVGSRTRKRKTAPVSDTKRCGPNKVDTERSLRTTVWRWRFPKIFAGSFAGSRRGGMLGSDMEGMKIDWLNSQGWPVPGLYRPAAGWPMWMRISAGNKKDGGMWWGEWEHPQRGTKSIWRLILFLPSKLIDHISRHKFGTSKLELLFSNIPKPINSFLLLQLGDAIWLTAGVKPDLTARRRCAESSKQLEEGEMDNSSTWSVRPIYAQVKVRLSSEQQREYPALESPTSHLSFFQHTHIRNSSSWWRTLLMMATLPADKWLTATDDHTMDYLVLFSSHSFFIRLCLSLLPDLTS